MRVRPACRPLEQLRLRLPVETPPDALSMRWVFLDYDGPEAARVSHGDLRPAGYPHPGYFALAHIRPVAPAT